MPVYTYRCENCGVQFDRQQSYTDEQLKVCPECRRKTLKKVISPVRIVFKGSGFYATDHKSPSGAPRPGNSHANGSDSEKGGHEHGSSEKTTTEKSSSEGASSTTGSTSTSSSASTSD